MNTVAADFVFSGLSMLCSDGGSEEEENTKERKEEYPERETLLGSF